MIGMKKKNRKATKKKKKSTIFLNQKEKNYKKAIG